MTSHHLPPLFARLPPGLAEAYDPEAPWALLGDPLDRLLADLPDDAIEIPLSPDFHLLGDRIAIGKGTRILPGAVIEGPARIGADCVIRPGAYIRGGVWIGDGCMVGASTEIKHAILLDGAAAPHLNYVGDSILGEKVNLGAGTVLSNLRHDKREVVLKVADEPLPTGRRKLGAILGDGVLTGCNSVLHPGVVVGRGTQIYPLATLRPTVYPADAIVKLKQSVEVVERLEGV